MCGAHGAHKSLYKIMVMAMNIYENDKFTQPVHMYVASNTHTHVARRIQLLPLYNTCWLRTAASALVQKWCREYIHFTERIMHSCPMD